jgi:ubiquinone biosynthesis protein
MIRFVINHKWSITVMLSIRKISAAGLAYRHYARYRQILAVVFAYGLDDMFGSFKVDKSISACINAVSRKRRNLAATLSGPQRFRMALAELGPTFIKLGQALSMRPDFIAMEYVDELSRLQDDVPPCPFEDIKGIIESEFNQSLSNLFDDFEKTPIASASIGQVHHARLNNGVEIAVKIQRPGLERIIAIDIGIMYHLAVLMERNVEEIAFIRPIMIVEEFARTIARELDYTLEADHMERFATNFKNDPTIHIPKVFRELTTRRVLTMEYVRGIKASDVAAMDNTGMDRQEVTRNGANIVLKQIFEHGFFHSDPHSGNIFILPDHVIAMLDFGQVGTVDQQSREDFVDLIDSVVLRNAQKATRQLLRISSWEKKPDIRLLEREVSDFIGSHLHTTLKDLNISALVQDLLHMVTRHRLRIPPDIFLMMKALATIEGIARRLDPDFDMIQQSAPFIQRIKLERLKPHRIADDLLTLSQETARFIRQFPNDLMELTRLIRERDLTLKIDETSLEKLQRNHNRIGSRVSLAILTAGLLIASALLITASVSSPSAGISFLGWTGMTAAALAGLGLLASIFRGRR